MDLHTLKENIRRTLPDAEIVETALDLCPNLRLRLISPDNMDRRFSVEEIQAILSEAPYWAFCWASGHALAYYMLQHRNLYENKNILDFGSGSGVAAIAASMAGAAMVTACDIDSSAREAIHANAALNRVRLNTCASLDEAPDNLDLIIAADVLYDRYNFHFLEMFLAYAPDILVAESRIKSIDLYPYQKIAELSSATLPDLDKFDEFRRVSIYRAVSPQNYTRGRPL